ncbi:hypothetical protein CC79DRAFT_1326965 [Sarocladium strictum]
MASMSTLRLVDISPETFLAAAGLIPLIGWPFCGNYFEPDSLLVVVNLPTAMINVVSVIAYQMGHGTPNPALWITLLPTIGSILVASRWDSIVEPHDQPDKVEGNLKNPPRVCGMMAFWVVMIRVVSEAFKLYNYDLPIVTCHNMAILLICFGGVTFANVFLRNAFVDNIFVPISARNGPVWNQLRSGSLGKAGETWTVITYIGCWLGFIMSVSEDSVQRT